MAALLQKMKKTEFFNYINKICDYIYPKWYVLRWCFYRKKYWEKTFRDQGTPSMHSALATVVIMKTKQKCAKHGTMFDVICLSVYDIDVFVMILNH